MTNLDERLIDSLVASQRDIVESNKKLSDVVDELKDEMKELPGRVKEAIQAAGICKVDERPEVNVNQNVDTENTQQHSETKSKSNLMLLLIALLVAISMLIQAIKATDQESIANPYSPPEVQTSPPLLSDN